MNELIVLKHAKALYVQQDGMRGRIALTTIDDVTFELEVATFAGVAELIGAALTIATSAGHARVEQPARTGRPPAGAITLAPNRYDIRPSPGRGHVALAVRFGVIDLEFHMPIHELRRIGTELLEAAAKADTEPKSVQ